jgi:hypothetical protein
MDLRSLQEHPGGMFTQASFSLIYLLIAVGNAKITIQAKSVSNTFISALSMNAYRG